MKFFSVLFSPSFIVAIFVASGCLAAQDVTGSEPTPSVAAPVTEEDNSVGTETVTTSSSNQITAESLDDQTVSDASPPPENDSTPATVHPSSLLTLAEESTVTPHPPGASEVVSDPPLRQTTTILPETVTARSSRMTTAASSTTIRLTTQPISTSGVTGPVQVVDHSTAGNLNESTTVRATESMSSSSTVSTTRKPTRTPRTTTERRTTTTTTTTTTPYHECVTSSTCLDPNAHCVSLGGTNTCECRTGFRKSSPNGSCVMIELPSTTTTTTSTTTTTTTPSPTENVTVMSSTSQRPNVTSSPVQSSSTEPPMSPVKRDIVRQATDLSKEEKMDVVSIALQPATSVVEWLLEQDLAFRTAIAKILTATNFSIVEEIETTKTVNVTADQVLYVAPSPQLTPEGLLISFLVQDKEKVKPRHYSFISGVIARHRREINSKKDVSTGYLPSVWITTAIRNSQHHLEAALNQTVSSLYGGVIPYQLLSLEQLAAASLFERRLDIFIPLILVAALGFMGLAVSLVCIRAKTRSMATWDPPAGVVFGKTSINKENREDPLGCTSKPDSTGHHLATDEQCRDGEEQLMKNSSRINADDDVWVVPYEDGPPQGQPGHLKTQYEDTKL